MDVFLAVIIVMVLMLVFLFVVLKGIVINVGKIAQNNVMRQLSLYDEIIEQREEKLRKLNKAVNRGQLRLVKGRYKKHPEYGKNNSSSLKQITISEGNFLDSDFPQKYQIVRSFAYNRKQCIKELIEQEKSEKTETYTSLIKQLLARFSLDEQYNLSTLEEEDQLIILKEVLSAEEFQLVEKFKELHLTFDCLEFFNWLEEEAFRFDQSIIVRTAYQDEDYHQLDGRIKTQYDRNLCEGLQVIMGNKLYDFAIHKREIGG
ncbi:MAG: hypothetical protein ACOYED_06980 [Peptococcia bacterium]